MDCDCTFAEPVHVKSRAAQSGASPQHDNFSSGFRSAAGNLAVQRRAQDPANIGAPSVGIASVAQHGLRGAGESLDHSTRNFMESRFGEDFSQVRVHTGKDASESARAINAAAYTVGHDVAFASGQYAPETPAGRHLLAHELTHVVQQGGGGSRSHNASLRIDNSGEDRAEEVAHSVAAGYSAGHIPSSSRRTVQAQWFPLGPLEMPIEGLPVPGEGLPIPGQGLPIPGEGLPIPGEGLPIPGEGLPIPGDGIPIPGEGLPTPGEGLPAPGQGIPAPGTSPSPWSQLLPHGLVDPLPFVRPAPDTRPRPDEEERRRDPECGSRNLPLTHVTFTPGPLGQGGTVKASPLTMCPGNTRGSMPSGDIYRQQFDCLAAAEGRDYTKYWVRAHLLHGETSTSGPFNLHGPGNQMWNLIITDKSLNGRMSREAERNIINLVYGSRAVLWYEAKVDSYYPGLDYFARRITVDAGVYNLATGGDGLRFPGYPKPFDLVRTPPNCPASLGPAAPAGTPGTAAAGAGAAGAAAASGSPALHTTMEQPAGAQFAFHSTLDFCFILESRKFPVSSGGVEVRIAADLADRSGRNRNPANCPFSSYNVTLKRKRTILWDVDQGNREVQVGQPTVLRWGELLDDDEYYLVISPAATPFELAAHPDCCLQGDLNVVTFSAPRRRPGMPEMA